MRRIFVTGIDTNVGKTVVSAVLTEALKADYWKPVQSGNETSDTQIVKNLVSNKLSSFHNESYSFKEPLSPHAAAVAEDTRIDIDNINLPLTKNNLIMEGAGGLLVPLNEEYFVVDLVKKFEAEVILVVKHYLGSINHTLLSIEALRKRNISFSIIINGNENFLSEKIIAQHAPVTGRIAHTVDVSPAFISEQAAHLKGVL